jgi:hypothetical protein
MLELMGDWAYHLERMFPNMHGAGTFVLGAIALGIVCLTMFAVTRRKTHLLALLAIALYVLPFML